MTRRTPAAVILACLTLIAVSVMLRTPVRLDARASTPGQKQNLAVPHQAAPAPAVLALSINGEPTFVSPSAPIPVVVPLPIPITATTPLVVNDGGVAIAATGPYTFVFVSDAKLPGLAERVGTLEVDVVRIEGKWVTADYSTPRGTQRMSFNTQALLAITARR